MVYYESGQGKNKKKYGVSVGVGPVKITGMRPSLRNQVKNVSKSVKEIQAKEELKYVDTFLNGSALTSTATLTLLNGMTLGDDVSNRDGNSIAPTSIQCRYLLSGVATSTNSDIVARHMILWDSQANGAAPSAGDILDGATIATSILSPYKRQYQKRFKILYDKVHVLRPQMVDPANATTEILVPVVYKKVKRSLSRVTNFRNAQNTGTITDIATNSLYSLWVTNAATALATVSAGYRMYFKDN